MRSVIARERKALDAVGGVAYQVEEDRLSVPAAGPDGFAVSLHAIHDRHFIVQYGEGWTHAFDRAEDAQDCFEFGLSERCRLRVTLRGETPVAWQVETREFGMWVPGRRLATWRVPFWRRARTVHRQNRVFRAAEPGGRQG